MGIYIIIGLELVFFAFVFWYVFIKPETRPQIKDNVWGSYEKVQKSKLVAFLNLFWSNSELSKYSLDDMDLDDDDASKNNAYYLEWPDNGSFTQKLKALIISWL